MRSFKRVLAIQAVTACSLFIGAPNAEAQTQAVRLNLYGGYTFSDKFNFTGYYGYDQAKIDEGAHFGGGLEIEMRPMTAVEIYYQQQPTTGRFLGTAEERSQGLNVSYLMLGGLRYAGNEKVKGFGGLMAGAAFFNSDEVNSTKFGWGARLGLFISANPKFGIRLGGQVLSAVQGASGGLYFGTGGAGAGVSTYSSLYQFGLFGGLSISLGAGGSARRSPPPQAPPAGYYAPAPPPPGQPMPPPPPPPPTR